jgi:putative inorganic carbon (HCO3(-)) transporter
MRDLIFACCWVVLFPAVFLSAHVGVLLWIWVALSTPNLMLYDFLSTFPFNKVIAIITFLVILFKPEKKNFYADKIVIFYSIFIIIGFLSNYMSTEYYTSSEDIYEKILKEYALFIVITGVMTTRHRLHVTVLTFCISLAVTGAFEAAAYVVSGTSHKVLGAGGLGDNNGIAVAMLMAIPLCYYVISYSEVRLMRIAFTILLFCDVLTVIATFSRGGFLGLVVLGIFLVLNARQKTPIIAAAVLVVLFMTFLAPEEILARLGSIQDADSNGSFLGRVVAWKVNLLAALDHPLIGVGFSAAARPDIWSHYVPMISSIGIIDTPMVPPTPLVAHSIFFQVLGDTGFIGLFCFVSVILAAIVYCFSIVRRCKGRPDLLWASDLARLLRVTIIVYTAAGSALSFSYFEGFWIIAAVISRLNHTTRQAVEGPAERVGYGVAEPVSTV